MTSSTGEVTDPWEMHRALESALVRFTAAYLNTHPGRVVDPKRFGADTRRFLDLRNSVLYRFESLAYHMDLIKHREDQCFHQFKDDIFRDDRVAIVRMASRDMKFLLDDVVFSTISLFDYFGNAIGFVLLGKRRQNIKWKGVLERSASKKLPTYQTVSRTRELNDEWIGGLTKYRHSLIHVASDESGGKLRHDITRDQALLYIRITAPTALIEEIRYLRETASKEGLPVTAAAVWLIGQTFDSIIELCDCLMRDVGLSVTSNP
jgi:hypothetical protein